MREVVRAALTTLPLALAVGVALALLGWGQGPVPAVLSGLLATGLVLLPAGLDRLRTVKVPGADGLPGFRTPPTLPSSPVLWIGVGGLVLVTVVLLSLTAATAVAAVAVMVLGGVGLGFLVVRQVQLVRSRDRVRRDLSRAVRQYGPRFVIHTARRNDASYQLTMWIPVLEKLGVPYLVVVRHPEAVTPARRVTTAPIVCCPTGPDLDAVVVDSIRVAFYVNTVAQNANFVLYRHLWHVYLGHGDSDKELSQHPAHQMFDRIFVAGAVAMDRYAAAGVVMPREKFVITGRPQLEGLAGPRGPVADLPQPRVLYAPTWRGYNDNTRLSSLGSARGLITALLERGAVIDFRPHPFSWQGGERADINAVDDLLRRDRERTGRSHQTAAEGRNQSLPDAFDRSDALITDVGSLLVDYFATAKPYAVVLPGGVTVEEAPQRFPTTGAALLLALDDLADPRRVAALLDDLLAADPTAAERARIAELYLGPEPGASAPFLTAVRDLLDQPRDTTGRRSPQD